MSYSDDLKKVLQLLQNTKYTYDVDKDEDYQKTKGRNEAKKSADMDTKMATAAGNTANFVNSYGKSGAEFVQKTAQNADLDLRENLTDKAKAAYQKQVDTLQTQAASLQKKIEAENARAAKAAAAKKSSSSKGSGSSSSSSSASSADKNADSGAYKDSQWNSYNPQFNKVVNGSRTAFSDAYLKAYQKNDSASVSGETARRAQGEYIYKACEQNITRAMEIAKAVGLDKKYIQRASDMRYYDEGRR